MVRNIHFWITILITLSISFIYYDWYYRYEWFFHFQVFELLRNIVGSLFFIPFLYGSIVFRWRGALFFWTLSFFVILPRIIFFSFHADALARNIILSLVPLMIVGIIALELKWRERQRNILEQREQERELYISQIFKTQENERQRIAQELHDSAMQELLVIANRANGLASHRKSNSGETFIERAAWIRDAIIQVSEDLRRLSIDLRPSVLDTIGLLSGLRWLGNNLNQSSKIITKVIVNGHPKRLSPENESTVFRIVQEALRNIRRHSGATEAVVELTYNRKSLKVIVKDNGRGFSVNREHGNFVAGGRLGLMGMQQRAKSINADFKINTELGKGTEISFETKI